MRKVKIENISTPVICPHCGAYQLHYSWYKGTHKCVKCGREFVHTPLPHGEYEHLEGERVVAEIPLPERMGEDVDLTTSPHLKAYIKYLPSARWKFKCRCGAENTFYGDPEHCYFCGRKYTLKDFLKPHHVVIGYYREGRQRRYVLLPDTAKVE